MAVTDILRDVKFVVLQFTDLFGTPKAVEQLGERYVYNKGLKTDNFVGKLTKIVPSTLTLMAELLYLDKTIVKPKLYSGHTVVQDRWYHTVLTHHPTNRWHDFLGRIFVPRLTRPHVFIMFKASHEDRYERLKHRVTNSDERMLVMDPELAD